MSDWRDIDDEKEKYAAYLCSREWAELRNSVRERCGGQCERCGVRGMDCVHHLTYARKYHERLVDLAGYCNECHRFTHAISGDHKPGRKASRSVRSVSATTNHAKLSSDGTYLAGGMPWPWIRAARAAGFLALPLALTLWQSRKYAKGGPFKIRRKTLLRVGIDRDQKRRGLKQLVDAGLVRIVAGGRGRCTTVELILEVPEVEASAS